MYTVAFEAGEGVRGEEGVADARRSAGIPIPPPPCTPPGDPL